MPRCWLITLEYNISTELVILAKVMICSGRICTQHLRLGFLEKIPSALKGKFSSCTSNNKANMQVSDRENYTGECVLVKQNL